jgi:DNA-binding MarR family transcriptional regulator
MKELNQGGFLISKIHQLSGRIFAKKLKDYNINEINPAQGRILFVLWQKDGISIQELAKKTALGKSTLTRMLDRLEESGHLSRFFPESDKRRVLIFLADGNKKMKESYEKVSFDMLKLYYEGFSNDEIAQFEAYLGRIYDNLIINQNN